VDSDTTPDSDPTPDPAPFFSDFKDAKKKIFTKISYFFLSTYQQARYHLFVAG
jgi:hypothetical protein